MDQRPHAEFSLHLPISGKTHQHPHILPGPQVGTRLALPSEARLSPQPSPNREMLHMGDAPTRQRLFGFMFLMVRRNARPGESPRPLVMRATRLVLILLLTVLSTAVAGSAEPLVFIPIDLGTLGGNALANAVNDSGRVVGVVYGAAFRAFSWTPADGMIDLGNLGCGGDSEATAVNASGQIVGSVTTCDASNHAFSWTPTGGMIDPGTLGGRAAAPFAVNDSGQVVGWSNPTGDSRFHAFSWTPAGRMVDLGTLGGSDSFALAVNASGQVVGGVSGTRNRAFSWTQAEEMIDLGTLGGTTAGVSIAVAVNDSGDGVGSNSHNGAQHAIS